MQKACSSLLIPSINLKYSTSKTSVSQPFFPRGILGQLYQYLATVTKIELFARVSYSVLKVFVSFLTDWRVGHPWQEQILAVVPPMASGRLHNNGSRFVGVDRGRCRRACRSPVALSTLEEVPAVRALRRGHQLHARQNVQRLVGLEGRRLLQENKLSSMVSKIWFTAKIHLKVLFN